MKKHHPIPGPYNGTKLFHEIRTLSFLHAVDGPKSMLRQYLHWHLLLASHYFIIRTMYSLEEKGVIKIDRPVLLRQHHLQNQLTKKLGNDAMWAFQTLSSKPVKLAHTLNQSLYIGKNCIHNKIWNNRYWKFYNQDKGKESGVGKASELEWMYIRICSKYG